MSGDETTEGSPCEFCAYDLSGLPSGTCPECGKEQPRRTTERLVRADRIWIGLSLTGAAVFAVLSWLAMGVGIVLGGAYTGDVELVEFTVGFAVISAAHAIAAFEFFHHRAKLRRVRSGTLAALCLVIVLVGFLAFGIVFILVASIG